LSTLPRDIDLYAICDSYLTDNFVKSNLYYTRVDKYLQLNLFLDKPAVVSLDPKKINVLLIEKTEREVKEMLTTKFDLLMNKILTTGQVPPATTLPPSTHGASGPNVSDGAADGRPAALLNKTADALFNPHCNENLQELLFDYQFLTALKECKARLNRKVFGRISHDVVISTDSGHLLYERTVNPENIGVSSFAPLEPATVDTLVQNLNTVYSTYRQRGFDYIFLCVIPNSATILEKNRTYNQLIPLLYKHAALKIPVVDIYEKFRTTSLDIIAKGDTHWNSTGFYLWLEQINDQLEILPSRGK
ncbi:MAG TPA: hypothetical protein VN824_12095, partial [Puia sp.]|nr:hypothetical protein [Puia sp.]